MGERPKCVAIAAADARGAIDQFAHRAGDGPGKTSPMMMVAKTTASPAGMVKMR